ncbi:MAG: hypothetical protein LQ351_002829 [Letrouitia transgressa]|nr:MAG: hypothetical protein LQ351_002829 [Letrouitia transgressa]
MSSGSSQPHVAYCEEYNEEARTTLSETRQEANVAAKRSKPDIAKQKRSGRAHDVANHSDLSNEIVAVSGGENLSSDSKTAPGALTLDTSAGTLAAGERKTQEMEKKVQRSPLKPSLRRSDSNARHKESLRYKMSNCEQCQGKIKTKFAKVPITLSASTRPDPATMKQEGKAKSNPPSPPKPAKPPTPTSARDIPILQPARPRPRNPNSESYRGARPISFHGGVVPEPMYYQPFLVEQRPPVVFPPQSPFPPPSYPPPRSSYFPASLQHPSHPSHQDYYPVSASPFEPHPQSQQHPWGSEHHAQPRQPMIYTTAPIVEYPKPHQYASSNLPSQDMPYRSFSQRDRERTVPLRDELFQLDEDYYRKPPPPVPPKPPSRPQQPQQRPAMKHAATTNTHQYYPADSGQGSPKKEVSGENDKHKRQPLAPRQPTSTNSDNSAGLHGLERSFARLNVEGGSAAAKQRRRVTYYGGEPPKELERLVEDYQAQKNADGGANSIPFTVDSLKLVRKKTQTSNSDAGSRASGEGRASREGSDIKPRSATGRRGSSDVRSRNDSDALTMRFNPARGVNLDLKGGTEGRTISLRQSRDGDGNMELSIGARSEARDKSRRRQSYVDGSSVRELESPRTTSRIGRLFRRNDDGKPKERLLASSRSRRNSRSGRAVVE